VKILFSMRHAGALRNFASTIRELSRRGHHVHLAFMIRDEEAEAGLLQQRARPSNGDV
jgi:predicted glycosyltransferase